MSANKLVVRVLFCGGFCRRCERSRLCVRLVCALVYLPHYPQMCLPLTENTQASEVVFGLAECKKGARARGRTLG